MHAYNVYEDQTDMKAHVHVYHSNTSLSIGLEKSHHVHVDG